MPKPRKAGRFGGSPGHHNLMMANLATELFRHGRIRTTHAKAKTVQPIAERMITLAKRGDLHSRRQVLQVIRDRDIVHHLFADVGPAFSERNGGYTRVLKLGARKGDAAPMALIELVDEVTATESVPEDSSRRRWSLRRRDRGAAASAEAPAEDVAVATDEDVDEDEETQVEARVDNAGAVVPEIETEDDDSTTDEDEDVEASDDDEDDEPSA
jgi:large subunit ribosomal protein L17